MPAESKIADAVASSPRAAPGISAVAKPLAFLCLSIIAIATVGALAFSIFGSDIKEAMQNDLYAVARLRATQAEAYLAERRSDAEVFAGRSSVASLLAGTPAPDVQQQLFRSAEYSSQGLGRYVRVMVFDGRGQLRWHFGQGRDVHPGIAAAVAKVIAEDRPGLVDVHRRETPAGGLLAFGVVAPIPRERLPGTGPLGAVYLEMVPEQVLLPLVEGWPTESETAETQLVRRDADRVVYLSRLRHLQDEPRFFSLPMDSPKLLAATALRTDESNLEGVDYRGVATIGAARRVQGTPWYVIAKVDQSEAERPLRRLAVAITILALVLVGVAALLARLFWRAATLELSLFARSAELERARLAERYAVLSRNANDAIFLFDDGLRIVEANERAIASYGYTIEEFRRMTAPELRTDEERKTFATMRGRVDACGGAMERTVHRRKDGAEFPVEVNARGLMFDGRRHYLTVVRDRSEELAAISRFEQAVQTTVDGFALVGPDLRFIEVNRALCAMTGYSEEELLGMGIHDVNILESDAELLAHVEAIVAGKGRRFDSRWRRRDGVLIDVSISVSDVLEGGLVCIFVRDITDRIAERKRLRALNRLYSLLSRANETIVRERDPARMMQAVCDVAVTDGNFTLAWVGRRNPDTGRVAVAAAAGVSTAFLDRVLKSIPTLDDISGGPTQAAASRGAPVIVNDFLHDERTAPWHAIAEQVGIGSSASFPLLLDGRVTGTISFYSGEADYFDADLVKLLGELAHDVAFALELAHAEAQGARAREALVASEALYRSVFESAAIGIARVSPQGVIVEVNSELCSILGYTIDEVLGADFRRLSFPEDIPKDEATLQSLLALGSGSVRFEHRGRHKNGSGVWTIISGRLVRQNDGSPDYILATMQDISERRAVEQALVETNRKLGLAEEVARIGAFAFYPGEDRWESSAVIDDIFGVDGDYPRNTESWMRLVDPAYREHVEALLRRNAVMTGDLDVEYPIRRVKDGASRWVHTVGRFEAASDGAPGRLVGMTRDVTVRRTAEERMMASEERLARILESSPLPIQLMDISDGTTRFLNGAYRRLLGYEAAEVRNPADWKNTVYPDPGFADAVYERWMADVERLRAGADLVESPELQIRAKDGRILWAQAHMRLVGAEAVVVWTDLTARKAMEDELRESEARFRALVEQSMTGIFVIDEGRIVYANPRFAEMLGHTTDEVIGRSTEDFVVPEDMPVVKAARSRLDSGEKTVTFTARARRGDGLVSSFGVNGVQASFAGRPAVISLAQDITERVRAQERIAAYADQLEQAMFGSIDAIASMVDLRDPYTSGHERRVAAIASALGRELGMDPAACKALELMGAVHDIGKIAVPAEILAKPKGLTPIEFDMIKEHAQAGYDILKDVRFPWPIADAVHQHHERLDGSGYPQGLKGEQIIPEARILAVADVVESMSSHRPYRPARGMDAALAEIVSKRGTQFDTAVVDAMVRLVREKAYVIPA